VETGAILNKLKAAVPGSVLEKSRFGRSESLSLWVESQTMPEVASFLKSQPEIRMDWLENLSAIQMDKAIVVTYFLRSFEGEGTLIVRASVEPPGAAREVELPSVARTWEMAAPFEKEIQDLFGVIFTGQDGKRVYPGTDRLPMGWNGFPLRKSYVFPSEFLGISHVRRRTSPEGNA
jgi:NADH-quinone oxidoreductase subunit C